MNQSLLHRLTQRCTALVAVALLAGCTIAPDPKPGDGEYAPVSAPAMAAPPPQSGSLYRPGYGLALYDDNRPHRIGDIVTVVLTERTTSSKSAGADAGKSSSISIGAGTVLGQPVTAGDGRYTLETALEGSRDFEGEASAKQSNNLQGSITVMVADILPNGLLDVRGEKWVTLNRGEEFIRLRGFIRPEDIQRDNTIASTKVADARISYSGTGELAQPSRQGWATRFFNSEFWPF
jgi:flagellar L-ring protein precursor FlgH